MSGEGVSLISDGFGLDGVPSTLLLEDFAQSSVYQPTFASYITDGFGVDTNAAGLLREFFSAWPGMPPIPGAGRQYTDCTTTSWTGDSEQENQSPAVAVTDVFLNDLATQDGYSILCNGDGTLVIDAHGDTTRQSLLADIWDVDVGAFYGAFSVNINNHAPQLDNQPPDVAILSGFPYSFNFLAGYVSDQDDDVLSAAITAGSLPTGLTLNAVGGAISGTPTSAVNNALTVEFTDPAGATLDVTFNLQTATGASVPDIVGDDSVSAVADLTDAGLLIFSTGGVFDPSPAGTVLIQSPAAGTQVLSGSFVSVVLSLGVFIPPPPLREDPAPRIRRTRTLLVLPYEDVASQLTPAERAEQMRLDALREQMQGVFTGSQPVLQAMVDTYRAEQVRIANMTEAEKALEAKFKDLKLQ